MTKEKERNDIALQYRKSVWVAKVFVDDLHETFYWHMLYSIGFEITEDDHHRLEHLINSLDDAKAYLQNISKGFRSE